jgi:NAD(P)-dependent dehydrogenase (short-subunit alcohol dehydrogenase family)
VQTRRLVEAEGRRGLAVRADVTNPDDCTALASAAMSAFGRVDVLVNNAGVGTAVPALKETPEQFRSVVDLNLNASYWMAQACGRVIQPGSSIINISSVLALTSIGLPQAAYTASKAGVIGLTRDLAQQWTGRKGIRVNAIAPGHFESEMSGQFDERAHAAVVARAAAGRTQRGADIPRQPRQQLCHRHRPAGRRRSVAHLMAKTSQPTRAPNKVLYLPDWYRRANENSRTYRGTRLLCSPESPRAT